MTFDIGLRAKLEPELDERKTKREVKDLEDAMEQAEQLDVDVNTDAVGGVGGGVGGGGATGGAAPAAGGSFSDEVGAELAAGGIASRLAGRAGMASAAGGGAGGAAAGAGAGVAGSVGSAAGAIAPVALSGAVAIGMLSGIDKLASASPAWEKTTSMIGQAWELFWRPMGEAMSSHWRPMAESLLQFAADWNQWSSKNRELLNSIVGWSLDVQQGNLLGAMEETNDILDELFGSGEMFGDLPSKDLWGGIITNTTPRSLWGDLIDRDQQVGGDELVDTSDPVPPEIFMPRQNERSVWDFITTREKSFWNEFIKDDRQRQFWTEFVAGESRNLFGDILRGDTRNVWENYIQGNARDIWQHYIDGEQKQLFADLISDVPFPVQRVFEGAVSLAERITGIVDIAEMLGIDTGDGSGGSGNRGDPADPPDFLDRDAPNPRDVDGEGPTRDPGPGEGDPRGGDPVPMASGGLVTRPTNVVAGEAGPEAILPLDDLRSIMASSVEQAVSSAMMQSGAGGDPGSALPARREAGGTDLEQQLERLRQEIRTQSTEVRADVDGQTLLRVKQKAHKRYANARRSR